MSIFLFFASFLISTDVFAAHKTVNTFRTDSLYDCQSGNSEFSIDVGVLNGEVKQLLGSSKTAYSGYSTLIELGYGLADWITPYVEQEYSSLKRVYTSPNYEINLQGVGDTKFGIKGLSSDPFFLYYNLAYSSGLLNHANYNYDASTAAPVGDRPHLDVEFAFGLTGADVSIGLLGGLNTYFKNNVPVTNGGTTTNTSLENGNGSTVKAFVQYNPSFIMGVWYSAQDISSYPSISNGTASTVSEQNISETGMYGIVPIASSEVLLSYSAYVFNKPSNTTSTLTAATLGLRTVF